MCSAKARVTFWEDMNKWILQHADDHVCEPNRPRVIAEMLRERMKCLVRKDPAKAVGKAVRTVIELIEIVEKLFKSAKHV